MDPEEPPRVLLPGAPIPDDGIGAYPLFLHTMGVTLRNLPTLLGIYLPLAAVSTAIFFVGAPTLANPPPPTGQPASFDIPTNEWIALAGWLLFLFSIGTWSAVALLRSAHAALTTGRALGYGAAYGSAIDRVPAFFATQWLYGLIILAGFVACCVPGLWWAVLFAPALPRVATRAVGPIQALKDAKWLVHGRYWRVAGFLSLLALVIYAINIPYFVSSFVLPHGEAWAVWVRGIACTIATALIGVIQMSAYAALHERLEETA